MPRVDPVTKAQYTTTVFDFTLVLSTGWTGKLINPTFEIDGLLFRAAFQKATFVPGSEINRAHLSGIAHGLVTQFGIRNKAVIEQYKQQKQAAGHD